MLSMRLRKLNGEKDFSQILLFDGTLYVMKVACTVWSGGKIGDEIKNLPITILSLYNIHIWFM